MPCYPCPIPKPGENFPHEVICGDSDDEAALNLAIHLIQGHWEAPTPTADDPNIDLNAEILAYLKNLKNGLEGSVRVDADVSEARRRA